MYLNIKPKQIAEGIVEWTAYSSGAIKTSFIKEVYFDDYGNILVTALDGNVYNCHPLVTTCKTPDKVLNNKIIFSEDNYLVEEGVHPIRYIHCN